LFPYTTLFRSRDVQRAVVAHLLDSPDGALVNPYVGEQVIRVFRPGMVSDFHLLQLGPGQGGVTDRRLDGRLSLALLGIFRRRGALALLDGRIFRLRLLSRAVHHSAQDQDTSNQRSE